MTQNGVWGAFVCVAVVFFQTGLRQTVIPLRQLFLGKRNCVCGGGIVRCCFRGFAVVLQGSVFVAKFFVGLAHHALDEGIVLVRLLKLLQCRLVISCIERDVALEIREERRLLRNGALVENGLGRSNRSEER